MVLLLDSWTDALALVFVVAILPFVATVAVVVTSRAAVWWASWRQWWWWSW